MSPDLRNASYDAFVAFVFDHYPEDEVDNKWYWHLDEDVEVDPRRVVEHLTRMCTHASQLLDEYTPMQVAEGLNYVFGAGGSSEFRDQFWNPDVPWPERRRCILAIPRLYHDVLERDPDGVGGCAYMLWDSIAYDYYCGNRDPGRNPEDARVQDAMLEALTSMLASDHPETQRGALHGLGHLSHRDSSRVIRDFLSSGRAIEPAVRTYGAQVLEGHFQ
jgi:hypothetical protein